MTHLTFTRLPSDRPTRSVNRRRVRRRSMTHDNAAEMDSTPCPYRMFARSRHLIRRLTMAYGDLVNQGILGGHDVGIDDTDCENIMLDLAEQEWKVGRKIVGICYYTDYDSCHVDQTGTLYLGWREYDPEVMSSTEVAKTIQAALENRGLLTRWDGNEELKLEIYGLAEPWNDYWTPIDVAVR